ncbi:MAG: NAD-dependent epimerase/dehydratase family protein [Phycisphaera sp.]|nr:NAD-dependent epimerase/dehydratase family protein [Phycisphaera sp.]
MSQVLVTGGAGFVGSHLTEALLASGDRVAVLDDLSTGNRENLRAVQNHPGLTFIDGSILDRTLVHRLIHESDTVYHLASAVGVRLVIEQPVRTIQTIVEGTDNVLTVARQTGCRVVLTSTSEVYGKGVRVPFAEGDDVVLGPTTRRRWVYACAKMLDEFLALAHRHEGGLPVTCVRLFNTVGPRQSGAYGMVLPRFVKQALEGGPITVYGSGEQTRCFCHVLDIVPALIELGRRSGIGDCPDVVNLGSDEEVSINELARRVWQEVELTRQKGGDPAADATRQRIEHIPYEQAYVEGFEDLGRRVPDLTQAQRHLGFNVTRNLQQIIRDMIEYSCEQ